MCCRVILTKIGKSRTDRIRIVDKLTITNVLGNGFPNEIFVKVNAAHVAGEHVDLDVDEKAVAQHQLEGLLVAPLAEDDFLRPQLVLELLQRGFQLAGALVVRRPHETTFFCIIPLRLMILVG